MKGMELGGGREETEKRNTGLKREAKEPWGRALGINPASPRPAVQLTRHLRDFAGHSSVPGSADLEWDVRFLGPSRGNDIRAVTSLPHPQSG